MSVEFSGPLFDGRAEAALKAGADDAEQQVAQTVRDLVRNLLRASARQRTGFYESRVQVERAQADLAVTDHGVRYGPWLEGASRRNARSRFKGYRMWRRAHRQAEPQAVVDAEQVLGKYIDRMG